MALSGCRGRARARSGATGDVSPHKRAAGGRRGGVVVGGRARGRPRRLGVRGHVAEEREGGAAFAVQAGAEVGIGLGLGGGTVALGRRERASGRDGDGHLDAAGIEAEHTDMGVSG